MNRGACEGNQEDWYFNHLKGLIKREDHRKHEVNFNLACTNGGSPLVVAKRANAASVGHFERLAAFDYDGKHQEFIGALDFCKNNKIVSGYSNYCFDLWLLLHKTRYMKSVSNANDYEAEVRIVYDLYEEADIKKESVIKQILLQITIEDVHRAIENAEYITTHNEQVKDALFTTSSVKFFENPDLSIHKFVAKVLHDAGL
jgi:hypothetical protein